MTIGELKTFIKILQEAGCNDTTVIQVATKSGNIKELVKGQVYNVAGPVLHIK